MVASLKEQKEAFVTGHDGTTAWEVLLVCLSAPLGLAFFQSLPSSLKQTSWGCIFLEALSLWFPMVLCQTNLLYPWGIGILAVQCFTVVAFLVNAPKSKATTIAADTKKSPRLDYLTMYRSSLLYLTFVAILAVDFHVFPRRFAKTEVLGYGLMDVGAASFVFSAGLVSPKARGGGRGGSFSPATTSRSYTVRRYLLHTFPLVALGFIRLATNKGLEYQEHVSEYGVHWNFFFTLGALAMMTPLVVIKTPTFYLPVAILAVYQLCLSRLKLQEYIESASRTCSSTATFNSSESLSPLALFFCNAMAANREGILGCVGYLAVYLLGEAVAFYGLWNGKSQENNMTNLLLFSGVLWVLHWIMTDGVGIPVSRRSTNASFCIWITAHNTLLLSLIQLATMVGTRIHLASNQVRRPTNLLPPVMKTVNRYGLIMFLIANLLTGLVNLTVPTLDIGDTPALFIVFGYICAVGFIAVLLDTLYERIIKVRSTRVVGKRD
jgi:glucosaminylphosphatidylinositol acyltransferase